MKKLSEFAGQEHVTSVLRASIIKNDRIQKLALIGDSDLAREIIRAYRQSYTCEKPVRGDACGECRSCAGLVQYFAPIDVFNDFTVDAVNFELKTPAGTYVNPEILTLLIYAYQGDRADVMKFAKTLALDLTFEELSQGLISIFTNILYLKSNLEITETNKIEALRALSVRMSTFDVTAAIRLLWDSQNQRVLPDQLRVETVSLLLSEVFQPTPTPDKLVVQSDNTPIKVVEEDILEQPMSLEEMLAVAHS